MGPQTTSPLIQGWEAVSLEAMRALDPDGDFPKKHLINPTIFRLVGDLTGRRVLDAGAGQGYLSRLLAVRGAVVTAVEPAAGLFEYGRTQESNHPQGITWVQADLTAYRAPASYDVVVASMVFLSIPDWTRALEACVDALVPGGLLVFSVDHPCFEPGAAAWSADGVAPLREYLAEYVMDRPTAPDTHRTISTYLNGVLATGCRITEVAEPGLAPALVASGPPAAAAMVHIPTFLLVAAIKD